MIADKDRSYYIGASDTERVIQSWETKTFANWWMVKQGFAVNDYENIAMQTGNALEHRILESLNIPDLILDEQKIIGRLRVNLDGRAGGVIYECKTHKPKPNWKPPLRYYRQVWVQIEHFGADCGEIVAYELTAEEYENWYLPIDPRRIRRFPVAPNNGFIKEYRPRERYLEHCLERGIWPKESEVKRWNFEQGY